MNAAENIAKKHFPCTCGEIYLSRNLTAPDYPYHSLDWQSAMQEIAELAFGAGREYQHAIEFGKVPTDKPNNIEFVKQLFAEKEEDYDLPNDWEPNYNTETPEERRDEAIKQQNLK